ncbi:MAG: type IV pilus modification protein PilV [Parashewanella sp.]
MTKLKLLTLFRSKQRGSSFIELLVAMVILVIGLIGIFNLHLIAKQGSFESYQQTQAAYLAHDILNRMKLNRDGLAGYAGTYTGVLTQPTSLCDQLTSNCDSVTMRSADLFQWEQMLKGSAEKEGSRDVGGLDTPTACITINGRDVAVAITWKGIRKLSDGATAHYTNVPACGDAGVQRRMYAVVTVIR